MKKLKLLMVFTFAALLSFAQTPIYTLDFETTGGYTPSVLEFTDGFTDFWLRTNGSDISTSVVYNNIEGSFFFAGMDIDGEGAALPVFLDIDDIDISGQTNLIFSVYLAEDDDGTNQDWDALNDYLHIYYDIDNTGTFNNLLWIENDGTTYNGAPLIDTDFNGIGDGAEITDIFTQYTVALPSGGSLLDLKFEFYLDSGDEDIAIDNIQILAGTGPAPLNANFSADATSVPEGTTVNFTDFTTGGTTPYTYAWDLDGDGQYDDSTDPNPSFLYSTAGTYTVALQVTDDDSNVDVETKSDYITVFAVNAVSDIAALRAGTIGQQYLLTNEAILTYQQTFRNQKYIEDGSGAILIDDQPGVITTSYSIGDGITGISGTLGEYNGMLQFYPDADPGAATTNGNTITPQVITLAELTANFENYEAELITVNDVTFADAGGTFATGTLYSISDASKGTFNFYTNFYAADYIGTTIPSLVNLTMLAGERFEGQIVTARTSADFVLTGLPTIEKAYAISNTEVEVFYNIAPSSVDPGDFYILGTELITFASATIDGTNPNLVHLSGAFTPMTGDIIVDELFDDAYGSSYVFYAGILPISLTNFNNPGGTISEDTVATFQGIVSANDGFNGVWVSDAAGQYNGILVYDETFATLAAQGDEILFAGVKDIFSNVSEIKFPTLINTLSTGNTPYGPDVIPGSDIDETILADASPAEAWEGQLVKIEDFVVESYVDFDYRCSWTDGTTTYYFHIGDNVDYHLLNISLTVGSSYQAVTGVVDWDYTNLYYRINPRDINDIEISSNPATQLAIVSVNGGINPYVSTDFDVVVQAQDAMGSPASVAGDVNFTFTTDGGTSGTVAFVSGTTTTGTILNGTSEITVSGVQMAPEGTNVTITASDDAIFGGLTAGTSAAFDVVEFSIPDIIITEIMQNPSAVADDKGEWFEVYNNSATPVDMDGWTIKDDGSNSHTIAGSVIVPAFGFAVLGLNDDLLTNGGVTLDYVYSSFTLGNSDDEVVLVLPDGVTEVDRITYDGGPVWPDPAGASMTFTGFPTEDNNDGTKWVWSTFREGNYDATADDKGSPGANGYDQILTGGFKLDLKVYLEGSFINADSMSNYFRDNSMLPYYHPFDPVLPYYENNAPSWQLTGNDTLSFVPFPTTDWLLIELRDASSAAGATGGTMVAQYPALLSDTGTVVSMNGSMPLNISESFSNDLFIVVYNLNHLAVMNATGIAPLDGTVVSYDFSSGSAQYFGGAAAAKELATGVWGMMSGDVNGDQTVDGTDLINGWNTEAAEAGSYQGTNTNPDGQIDNKDKNDKLIPNMGMSSSVPN